jgi:hypothetical protein
MEQKIDLESSLKLLYDFLKLGKRTADFPCTLDVIFGVYCVWIKQDSAVQSPGTAELWPQQATFVLISRNWKNSSFLCRTINLDSVLIAMVAFAP